MVKNCRDSDDWFNCPHDAKHRKINPPSLSSELLSLEQSSDSQQQVVVVVIVHLDYSFRSKILTNFYRLITKCKIDSLILNDINNSSMALSYDLIYHHTNHNSSGNSQSIGSPQLLYRGSRDGFKDIDFHSRCDNQGPTLTLIKSLSETNEPTTNQIFGGFTTQSWKSPPLDDDRWIPDDSAFLFKIEYDKHQSSSLFRKFNIKQSMKQYAIYVHSNYLPTFGAGYDICICSDCNLIDDSFTQFGDTYETTSSSSTTTTTLSTTTNDYPPDYFTVSEIEVFKINNNNNISYK